MRPIVFPAFGGLSRFHYSRPVGCATLVCASRRGVLEAARGLGQLWGHSEIPVDALACNINQLGSL